MAERKADLLVYPSLVETPFIIVEIGDYSFGVAMKNKEIRENYIRSKANFFPNYIKTLQVEKINGAVNKYTLSLEYRIAFGDNPNMFEQIFSSVSNTRKITFSYGDWSYPSYIYQKEEAIITQISQSFNASSSSINYEISAVSSSNLIGAVRANFPQRYAKASDVIKSLLANEQYGLQKLFPGMTQQNIVKYNLIPGNDKIVEIHSKEGISIIDYLQYLVNCMQFEGDESTNGIKKYIYILTLYNHQDNNVGGEYFKITMLNINPEYEYTDNLCTYELNIGYPDKNLVTDFRLQQNDNWSILYNYNKSISDAPKKVYYIDNNGNMKVTSANNLTMDYTISKESEAERNWWSQVTAFPIKASVTMKGLVRPQLLMSYVKINVYFYGQKHISSGIYCVTKQVDSIGGGGYRTTLELLRIKGDEL